MTEELPLCECGCGEPIRKKGNRFIFGHQRRGKKPSPETCAKISKSHKKRCEDPEERKRKSDIQKKRYEDPKEREKTSKANKKRWADPILRKKLSDINRKEKEPLPDGYKIDKNRGMVMNKDCGSFLGCYVAEQVLSKIFKNVKIMPYANSGYDFICNRNLKIDVKSAATGDRNSGWFFNIEWNKIADYFLLLAFNNRNDLIPEHLWLIPGEDINHRKGISISKSTISKWAKYEQSIDKVIACCNQMRD